MTNLRLDKIIVVDLEATCWEGEPPQRQISEIIEIGACSLNMKTLEIENKQSYLVKPRFSQVGEYCTRITSLSAEQVSRGMSFGDAVNKFKKEFGLKNRTWASWGRGDMDFFLRNCALYEIDYPFGEEHLNASTLFSLKYKLHERIGVENALQMMGMDFEGKPHRAIDDAYNTARIIKNTLN